MTKRPFIVAAAIGFIVLVIGLTQLPPVPAVRAQAADQDHDGHAGHDHGPAKTESPDDHASHDGHGDAGVIRLDPETMREFGIVVQEAGPGSLGQTLQLPGEVVFNADRIAHVTPSVFGIVQEVNKSVGDQVEAGEVMAVLSSRELAAARSEYLAAQARLELTKEILVRDERQLTDRIGTERQVLESRQAMREAEIALNLAEQNLHALGQDHTEIDALSGEDDTAFTAYEMKAPLAGVVIARHLTRGEKIGEEPADAPFVVADLSSVWVNLTVYQRDLASVQQGMPVRIRFGHGMPDAVGTVAFITPALDESTRTATARVVIKNPDRHWRPGLFVTGQVDTGDTTAAIVVPRSALAEVDGQTVVFVQMAEGFEPRAVSVGRTTKDHAEITDGLSSGDRYVARNVLAMKAELNRAALEHAGHVH